MRSERFVEGWPRPMPALLKSDIHEGMERDGKRGFKLYRFSK